MAVELFRTSDTLFVLAGYESGIVALWEINENAPKMIWQRKEHNEPGKIVEKKKKKLLFFVILMINFKK
jgi:hypothetical protein